MHLSYEHIPVSNVVLTVAALTVPVNATGALIQADSENAIRFTLDGGLSTPTPGHGLYLRNTAEPLYILIEDLKNIRFVRDNTTDTGLNIAYIAGRDV